MRCSLVCGVLFCPFQSVNTLLWWYDWINLSVHCTVRFKQAQVLRQVRAVIGLKNQGLHMTLCASFGYATGSEASKEHTISFNKIEA